MKQPPPSVVLAQMQHDALHPGKICGACPVEVWSQTEFVKDIDRWAARQVWKSRILMALICLVFAGLGALASSVH